MRHYAIGLVLGWAVLTAQAAEEADLTQGQILHETHCINCHKNLMNGEAEKIYTRPKRRIKDYPSLESQVRRCDQNLRLNWFDTELLNVTAYLNANYYHLEIPE